MTAPAGPTPARRAAAPPAPDTAAVVAGICPYVMADNGAWRAARPMAEHRCHAVQSPAALTGEQQRRLCLVAAHTTCPTFIDARRRRDEALTESGIHVERLAARRTIALTRPIPVIFDRPFTGPRMPLIDGRTRRLAEISLVAVMLLAAVILVVARLAGTGLFGSG